MIVTQFKRRTSPVPGSIREVTALIKMRLRLIEYDFAESETVENST